MNRLFMVCLGGKVTGCNIEMHDIRFVIGESIEHTFTTLKQQWCGDKANVHMDSYCEIKHVDGFDITLTQQQSESKQRLYFVNLGAYYPEHIMEQHSFELIVANSPEQAKQIALSRAPTQLQKTHKDRLMEVDDLLPIDLVDGYFIQLTYSGKSQDIKPAWFGYHPL
ncbi:DUF1543 domain-containing protein [Pseudoalteromonas sp.]|uniref:DUF1543 domain-containing protein n=1 Tax=Pseudoalteromonas sp. TaxID=53249 RepID=UPI0035627A34